LRICRAASIPVSVGSPTSRESSPAGVPRLCYSRFESVQYLRDHPQFWSFRQRRTDETAKRLVILYQHTYLHTKEDMRTPPRAHYKKEFSCSLVIIILYYIISVNYKNDRGSQKTHRRDRFVAENARLSCPTYPPQKTFPMIRHLDSGANEMDSYSRRSKPKHLCDRI
jgi:hypothetical protein